ncbi:MAG: shikimate dehydrogenase [Actinobacteria bacterium]|nr:shikimate dehydrogenase [Actinomycetota bacterium]
MVSTYLTGLVGAGIGASLSPALHEHEAAALGLRYEYRLIDVGELGVGVEQAPDLIRAARQLGFDGLNITHPCKQAALGALDELSPEVAVLGATNTVVFDGARAIGHNTDWSGFARALRHGLPGAPLGQVVVLGAGGAGSAVCYALGRLGADHVIVIDTDQARADGLADALTPELGPARLAAAGIEALSSVLARADGLVHATPTGMAGHPGNAVPARALVPDLWVADVVYRPLQTELLVAAHRAGCRTLDGGAMAVFQAADAFRLFTGVAPSTRRMFTHFAQLTSEEAADARRAG